jgi:excisionase family DNA binding protein
VNKTSTQILEPIRKDRILIPWSLPDRSAVSGGNQGNNMQPTSHERLAFTVSDAVIYSGLSRSRIYDLLQSNQIASVRVGGRRLIYRQAIDEFFAKLSEAA